MLRVRFEASADDSRPINWPVKHPWWETGVGDGYAIVVSYADDENYILENWPEAQNLDSEEADDNVFTSRFPKPEWFKDSDQ